MRIGQSLVREMLHEAETTRKVLGRVPDSLLGWKPHEKSSTMGMLASHIADITGWTGPIVTMDQLEIDSDYQPWLAANQEELMARFNRHLEEAVEQLEKQTDEHLSGTWSLIWGGQKVIEMARVSVLRGMVCNHCYHHRGQLSVYLRLNEIPVPAMYGPSADEMA